MNTKYRLVQRLTFNAEKNSRCSLTVNLSNKTLCCGHNPKLSRIASISVSVFFPLTLALPPLAGKSPVSIDIVVVLPKT